MGWGSKPTPGACRWLSRERPVPHHARSPRSRQPRCLGYVRSRLPVTLRGAQRRIRILSQSRGARLSMILVVAVGGLWWGFDHLSRPGRSPAPPEPSATLTDPSPARFEGSEPAASGELGAEAPRVVIEGRRPAPGGGGARSLARVPSPVIIDEELAKKPGVVRLDQARPEVTAHVVEDLAAHAAGNPAPSVL
jgi:hypothetical protein